jgi:hypothetical protein
MKWSPELRSKPRDEVLQKISPRLRLLIVKTADEDPESLEMGTRRAEDRGFDSLPGASSNRGQRKSAFRLSSIWSLAITARELAKPQCATSTNSIVFLCSET